MHLPLSNHHSSKSGWCDFHLFLPLLTSQKFGWLLRSENQAITLSEAPKMGEQLKITGVATVAKGNSREQVLEELKLDLYFEKGIWDQTKVCSVASFERSC
jgi:hypothetical protein